jgi:hypothetical protein
MVMRQKRDIGHIDVINHLLHKLLLTPLVFCRYIERKNENTNAAFG